MVYADVVVGVRGSSEELTYAVPAKIIPYIRVGSLVTVPVRRKLVRAVVVKLHQRVDSTLREKLREIYSIDKTHPGFSEAQLGAVQDLAKKYLAKPSDVMFRLLSSLRPIAVERAVPGRPSYLQGSWRERVRHYGEQADKYQETLILFPTKAHLEDFLKTGSSQIETIVLDGTARSRQKVLSLRGSAIFLGTVGDSFFPLKQPGLIIVDQPNHIGSCFSSRPYLRSDDIAQQRLSHEGHDVLIGAGLISFKDLRHAQQEQLTIVSLPLPKIPVTVASRLGSRELLLESVWEQLEENIENKRPSLLFVASRGWSNGVFCRSCARLLDCPSCGRTIGADQAGLNCRYCGHTGRKPNYCPHCKVAELVELGEGIDKFVEVLHQRLPNASLQVVAGAAKTIKTGVDVTIATEKILSFPEAAFESVVVASADRALTGSSLDDSWQLLTTLRELSAGGAEEVLVQTYFPEHPVWAAVNPDNLKAYFAAELGERKRYRLPPYAIALTLVGQYPNDSKLDEQLRGLEELLGKKLPTVEYSVEWTAATPQDDGRAELHLIIPLNVENLARSVLGQALPPNWAAVVG